MKEFWNSIQFAFAAIGGWLGWFLGGCDGLLIALIIFAVSRLYHRLHVRHRRQEAVLGSGLQGHLPQGADLHAGRHCKRLDIYVLNHAGVLRTAIIFFYISNEGLSLVENSVHLGLPVPEKAEGGFGAAPRPREHRYQGGQVT
jgi:phage-related holin